MPALRQLHSSCWFLHGMNTFIWFAPMWTSQLCSKPCNVDHEREPATYVSSHAVASDCARPCTLDSYLIISARAFVLVPARNYSRLAPFVRADAILPAAAISTLARLALCCVAAFNLFLLHFFRSSGLPPVGVSPDDYHCTEQQKPISYSQWVRP